MRWDNMTTLPLLKTVMRLKRATKTELSLISGVSERTIGTARAGKPIDATLAGYISQALVQNEFSRDKRGGW
ncbi:hypothetical protein [Oryzomonas rubra]|uniref:Uncharacterized protein n=1 Tax=Oryzomonas rubra TaxID=2509454 RepID=A0A5A9X6C9_9BACT|nr:hypothetical protein [Oryzomonas rubra]KAA0888732.1 hypothetical protein ET418_15240 [Oryzomonas rubra]